MNGRRGFSCERAERRPSRLPARAIEGRTHPSELVDRGIDERRRAEPRRPLGPALGVAPPPSLTPLRYVCDISG